MADVEKTEFEFPDEKESAEKQATESLKENEPEIEVVDDTPAEDRGRKPLAEPPKEFAEDELAKYDASVQQRIKHFTKGYHDERRAKEAALREKEEALRIAQAIVAENNQLKGNLGQSQAMALDSAKKLAVTDLEKAKAKYKEAYESGDSDAIADAQTALTAATIRAERIANFKPPLQRQQPDVQIAPQPAVQAPAPDSRAIEWQEKNRWFGQDEEMTSFALGLHTKLVNSGVDPRSEEYYERLNNRLKQVFPDAFESEKPVEAPSPRPKSNVAPATRSTAPKKIVLTQTQVNIAKKLGVPLELYARKVAEEMRK
jgi:hypothetical protein